MVQRGHKAASESSPRKKTRGQRRERDEPLGGGARPLVLGARALLPGDRARSPPLPPPPFSSLSLSPSCVSRLSSLPSLSTAPCTRPRSCSCLSLGSPSSSPSLNKHAPRHRATTATTPRRHHHPPLVHKEATCSAGQSLSPSPLTRTATVSRRLSRGRVRTLLLSEGPPFLGPRPASPECRLVDTCAGHSATRREAPGLALHVQRPRAERTDAPLRTRPQMLTNTALTLSLAATLATSAAAFHAPALHNHGIRSAHGAHAHKATKRDFVPVRAGLEGRAIVRPSRMTKRVRRSDCESLSRSSNDVDRKRRRLTLARHFSPRPSIANSTSSSSGTKYTSTAIWWKEAGWVGSCGVQIKESESVVALPLALYPDVRSKSSLCGTTVSVTATASGKTITATVVGASNRDDFTTFSKSAYLALEGDLDAGELAIEYYLDGAADIDVSNLNAVDSKTSTTTSEAPAAQTTTSAKPTATATTTHEAVKTDAVVQAAVQPAAKATTYTTSAAPAATSSSDSSSDDGSDDDWVCDDEDEEDSSPSSSSSAWVAPSSSSTSQWVAPSSSSKAAAATTTTTTSQWIAPTTTTTTQAAASTKVADTSSSVSLLSQAGIKGFLGDNDNAVLSWYNTNSGQDSTNGHSWCG